MNVGVSIFGLKEIFRKREIKEIEFIFNKNEAKFQKMSGNSIFADLESF